MALISNLWPNVFNLSSKWMFDQFLIKPTFHHLSTLLIHLCPVHISYSVGVGRFKHYQSTNLSKILCPPGHLWTKLWNVRQGKSIPSTSTSTQLWQLMAIMVLPSTEAYQDSMLFTKTTTQDMWKHERNTFHANRVGKRSGKVPRTRLAHVVNTSDQLTKGMHASAAVVGPTWKKEPEKK